MPLANFVGCPELRGSGFRHDQIGGQQMIAFPVSRSIRPEASLVRRQNGVGRMPRFRRRCVQQGQLRRSTPIATSVLRSIYLRARSVGRWAGGRQTPAKERRTFKFRVAISEAFSPYPLAPFPPSQARWLVWRFLKRPRHHVAGLLWWRLRSWAK